MDAQPGFSPEPESETVALSIPGLSTHLKLQVHGSNDQYLSRALREEGIWEPFETALLMASLGPGAVFLDVGANIGYYPVIAAQRVGEAGSVFAFEPDAKNFKLLRANLELNGCQQVVTAFEAGLAEESGAGQLFMSADNAGDHQIFASGEERPHRSITLLNGSECLGPLVARLDLLKVDVQGAEYAVMRGLLPLLEGLPRIPRMMIELTPQSLRQAGASGRQLIELLASFAQPMWIIDHIEHRLVACPPAELALWCDNVDATAGDAGFMNILVGDRVPGC